MTITAIIAAIGGLIAIIGGFLAGHKVASAKTEAEVMKAKTVTEATTRAAVAEETKVAAGQAQVESAAIRTAAVTQAQASGDKGKDALLDEMRADGEIQP